MKVKRNIISTFIVLITIVLAAIWPDGSNDLKEHALRNAKYGTVFDHVSGIDPILNRNSSSPEIGINIYEPLYQYHYLKRPYELIPCLAQDMPKISKDGLTYTISIKNEIFFQDNKCFPEGKGREVEAQDFIYSWKRIADPANASPVWPALKGHIKGLDEFREKLFQSKSDEKVFSEEISGMRALGKDRLRIQLTRPWPQLIYVLGQYFMSVIPREAVKYYGDNFMRNPVGTGPYILGDWNPDVRIIIKRNPHFRKEFYPSEGATGDMEKGLLEDTGKPMPFIDEVQYRVVRSNQPNWLMMMRGEIDFAGIPRESFNELIGADKEMTASGNKKGLKLYLFASSYTRWIGLNLKTPLIANNKPLRQALSLGISRKEFNDLFQNNRGSLPHGLIPPALEGHDKVKIHPLLKYNPERARQLLKEAEKVNGGPLPPIRLLMPGGMAVFRQVADYFKSNYERIGLKVNVSYVAEEDISASVQKYKAHIFMGPGFSPSTPDAIDIFKKFYGPNIKLGPNLFGYNNLDFDRLFEKASVMQRSPERMAIYKKMEAMILEDVPCLVFLDYNHYFVHHDWLKNCKAHAFWGWWGKAKYQRIDTKLRWKRISMQR